jgi:hypothetical protein
MDTAHLSGGGFAGMLLLSVGQGVLHHACCPVVATVSGQSEGHRAE